jgi:ribonucleotide monophosphatase NagD (HAD superfamily)
MGFMVVSQDVRDDISGAQALGMRGFLVQTGKYRTGDESRISPGPAVVCSHFSEAVDILLKEYSVSGRDS